MTDESLGDKRKKLFEEVEHLLNDENYGFDKNDIFDIFKVVEKQDKEAVKKLKKMGLSAWNCDKQDFVLHISHKEIDKIFGDKLK